MTIGFRVTYNQAQFRHLSDKLSAIEIKQVITQSTKDVATFLQGKMQEYPPEKRVTRKQAYGVTFFTDKQRRWFFAALNSGELELPYRRTGALREGWRIMHVENKYALTNDVGYAGFVQERSQQSRMQRIIGWKTVSTQLQRYKSELGRVGMTNIRRWAKS